MSSYDAPSDAFVAGFFGDINRLQARVANGRVATVLGEVEASGFADGLEVEVLIRPEALTLRPASSGELGGGGADGDGGGIARVMAARLLGRTSLVHLSVDGADGQDLHLHACTRACPGASCPRRTRSCPFNWIAVRPLFLPPVKLNNSLERIIDR